MAYVGTFSSPLRDTLPTQVDLPPGNGRGIHSFEIDRTTGAMKAAGEYELGTSPSCLAINSTGSRLYSANETDRFGPNKEGTVSSFEIDRSTGQLKLSLNTVSAGGAGPTYVSIHPSGFKTSTSRELLRRLGCSSTDTRRRSTRRSDGYQKRRRKNRPHESRTRAARQFRFQRS